MASPAHTGAPAQLFALRLHPGAPPARGPETDGLQGEVEHVLTGARCTFRSTAELVRWLNSHQGDQGPAPRDATM